jgi:outer membrane protein, heavy metal efflux system
MISRFILPVFVIGMVLFGASSLLAVEGKNIALEQVIEIALRENPELKALQAKVEAGKSRVRSSSSLPDPWLGLEYDNIPKGTLKFGQAEMKMYSFSQMIPWPGKLSLKSKISQAGVDILEQEYIAKKRKIIAQIKRSYFELYFIHKAIEVNNENSQLLGQTVKVAERKYSLGKASLAEALKAQIELSKINNNLSTLENKKQILEAKLNFLLNREPDASLGQPQYTDNNEFNYQLDKLYEIAKNNRPELKTAGYQVKQSELKLSLSKREYLPDFMITLKQREMDDELKGWNGMFNITVPLWFWRDQKYMVKEMQAEKGMKQADYQAMENMLFFEVKKMYLEADTALRQANLYKSSIVPQAEQVLKVSQTAYENDKMSFLDLLDSQRMYLEVKLDHYMSLVDYQMAKAEIEEAIGVSLP